MTYLEYQSKLEYILYCISSKTANTVAKLIQALNVSRRTVPRMVDALRYQGKDIVYCRRTRQYKLSQ